MCSRLGTELGVDPDSILQTSHGRRSIETLRLYDPSKANWECPSSDCSSSLNCPSPLTAILDVSAVEGAIPREFGADAALVPGAEAILASLESIDARWAIVTSGSRALVEGWLDVMQLVQPKHLIVAQDVEHGKPDPECYLLAKKRLGLDAETLACVVEDSIAGVISGKASNCKVLAVATTYPPRQLLRAGADWVINDLRDVQITGHDATGAVTIKICKSLESGGREKEKGLKGGTEP